MDFKSVKGLIKRALSPISTRIIIFQPGKVGSLTVQASLERAYTGRMYMVEIHHAHALNHLEERERFVQRTRVDPSDSLVLIRHWKELRARIDKYPGRRWYVINLVRDPVAIKVSALFQVLYQHIPDWEAQLQSGALTMSKLDELLFSKQEFGFSGLETWYDTQVREIWGLDIFKTPFPHEKGYQIYKKWNISMMIIRLEDLNRVAGRAFYDFLRLKDFQVVNANVGDEKPYAELYNQFKKRALPTDYLDQGYQNRFATYFYTPAEIKAFRNRWEGK
jgi:hypothetical protein